MHKLPALSLNLILDSSEGLSTHAFPSLGKFGDDDDDSFISLYS